MKFLFNYFVSIPRGYRPIFLGFSIIISIFCGCTSKNKNLPDAVGVTGDLYLFMDSAQWHGPLGIIMDSIFTTPVVGLPRREPMFKIRWIDPRKLSTVLKQRRNLIFAMTLDKTGKGVQVLKSLFSPQSIEKIKSDTSQFYQIEHNLFARGQEVMFLFSNSEPSLINKIRTHHKKLTYFFNQKEKERLSVSLFKSNQMSGITKLLQTKFRCSLKIPFGYKLADKRDDFMWVRQLNPKDDKDVFIARKVYKSKKDFSKANIINFRDSICREYLFRDPQYLDSYLVTEKRPYIPVRADTIQLNGNFCIRLTGLFRSNDFLLGGPFVGYAVVDEGTNQFYYLEGFTISPGVDQREIMRELEAILLTFKTSKEISNQVVEEQKSAK